MGPGRLRSTVAQAVTLEALHVLLAEDNPVNQEVATGMLESLGCALTVVDDGAKAVEAYTEAPAGRFQMILMDCQMPVMDGLEATRAIRAFESRGARIPILALTANALEASTTACLAAGMDDVLTKPFSRQELLALLERWRDRSTAGPRPAAATEGRPCGARLDPKPLDALRQLDRDGSNRILMRAIAKFADYGDDLIDRMGDAAERGDLVEVARLAHSLKSSSANLGAVELAEHCRALERLANGPDQPRAVAGRVARLQQAYRRARQELLAIGET